MKNEFVHKLSDGAKAHAKEVLGTKTYRANKDAVQSVGESFDAGAEWQAATTKTALTVLLEHLRHGNEITHSDLDSAATQLGIQLD